jgi:hypothetical protein
MKQNDNQIHVDCHKHHNHNYASSSSGCVKKDKEIALFRDNIQQLHWWRAVRTMREV